MTNVNENEAEKNARWEKVLQSITNGDNNCVIVSNTEIWYENASFYIGASRNPDGCNIVKMSDVNIPSDTKIVGECPLTGALLMEVEKDGVVHRNFTNVNSRVVFIDGSNHQIFTRIEPHLRKFIRCADCGVIHRKADMYDTERGYVCLTCVGNYRQCEHCGARVPKSVIDSRIVDGHVYCRSCINSYTHICEECGTRFFSVNSNVIDNTYHHICDACMAKKYVRCGECREFLLRGDNTKYEEYDGGMVICNHCKSRLLEHCVTDVAGYHCFPSSKYIVGRRRCPDEMPNIRYYGIELETEGMDFDDLDVESWMRDGNLIHAERDASLDEDTGIEWITMPCSLKFHQKEFSWKSLCKEMVSNGGKSHQTKTCGLHVHVNRSALSPSTIVKMDYIINRLKPINIIIARRYNFYSSYNSYANYDTERKINAIVGYWNSMPDSLRPEYRDLPCTWDHCRRYTAVNVTNPDTVEVRIFRGTLNPETIIGTIEYVDALIEFAEKCPLRCFDRRKTNNAILCHMFIDFLLEHRDKYSNAVSALKRLRTRNNLSNYDTGVLSEEFVNIKKHIGLEVPSGEPYYPKEDDNDNRSRYDNDDNDLSDDPF